MTVNRRYERRRTTYSCAVRDEFLLDPEIVFLNHGSFGACPRAVFERYQAWQRELERQPVEFLGRRIAPLLAEVRLALGEYVGADPDDLVLVPNATSGVNVAARSLRLEPGDEVLSTDLEYGALDLMWEHLCARAGARYVRMPVPLPTASLDEVAAAVWAGVSPRTRVLFVSHVTSQTALRLPVEELCARAREAGIVSIVDGAHGPALVPLDLEAIGADYYSGNCHKWLCAPKGAGFLHARRERQEDVDALVIGWGYGDDATFLTRHERQGTRDPAAYLTVPAAIEWLRDHAWEEAREDCRALALEARDALGLEALAPAELTLPMVTLVLPEDAPADLQERLYAEHRIEVPVFEHGDRRYVRASFHLYNTRDDVVALRDAIRAAAPPRAATAPPRAR
jgi:isopenicillin-N epimerase